MLLRGWLVAIASLALAGSVSAAAPGEFSVFAGYWSGDYGTGVESGTQAMTFRYVHGSRIRLRAEIPLLRIQPSEVVSPTGSSGSSIRGSGLGSPQQQGGNGPGQGGGGAYSIDGQSGIGDLRLAGAIDLVGGGIKLFRMDANLEFKLPTADAEQGLGTGEWDLRAGFSGEYRFWPVTAYGGVGWNRFGDPAWVELNDVFDAFAGLEGDASQGKIVVSGWVESCPEVVVNRGAETTAGLEFRSLGRYRWRVGFTAGIGGYEEYGVVFGYSFQTGAGSRGYRGMLR